MSRKVDYIDDEEEDVYPKNKQEQKRHKKLGEREFSKSKRKDNIREARKRKDAQRWNSVKLKDDYDD